MGEIITFYSYKGGTGRTMALANVGWILASAGKKVLLVDWDLEAPGLHRYLHPFLLDKELVASRGIIDVVMDFSIQAMTPSSGGEGSDWYKKYADVLRCALSLNWSEFGDGRLDLLPAGQQTATYATRVNSFSWDNFYERLGGGTFLEAVKASMKEEYDYVLVDSRTGVSDTSGICTVQLPDKVVICFTLNRQSIQGAAAVAESIVQARAKESKLPRLQIFPVPTRVERAEHVRLEAARIAAQDLFSNFLGDWDDSRRKEYWRDVEVFYQPYYAYEEVPATFGEERAEIGSMLYSMERLTAYLTGVSGWKMPSAEQRDRVLGQYLRVRPVAAVAEESPKPPDPISPVAEPAPSGPKTVVSLPSAMSTRFWFFISYVDRDDRPLIERLWNDLEGEIRRIMGLSGEEHVGFLDKFLDNSDVNRHSVSPHDRQYVWQQSRTAVCLISPRYLRSEQAGREFTILQQSVPVVPVMWERVAALPTALAQLQFARGAQLADRGLRNIMRVSRFQNDYVVCLRLLAQTILALGDVTRPYVDVPDKMAEVPNAFSETAAEPGSEALFVYAVPTRAQATSARLKADFYGETAGSWRPWGGRSLEEILKVAAMEARLRLRGVPADSNAIEQLQRSEREGQISLALLDPNALNIPGLVVRELRSIRRIWIITGTGSTLATQTEFREWGIDGPEAHNEEQLVSIVREELEKLRASAINRAAERRGFGSGLLPRLS